MPVPTPRPTSAGASGSGPPWTTPGWHAGAVVVAGVSKEVLPPHRAQDERARLDDGVGARHDRLVRRDHRLDLLAARRLARTAVATLLGGHPDDVRIRQVCPGCGATDHGLPGASLGSTPVALSWAHSGGRVAAAAAPGHLRVGVDVETGDGTGWPGTTAHERAVLGRLAPAERPVAFRRLWSAKEALVKAGLLGLDDLDHTDLHLLEGSRRARWWTFDGTDGVVVGLAVVGAGQERCEGSVP